MSNRDFYAPDGQIIFESYRAWYDNKDEYPYLLKLSRPWEKPEIYLAALIWIVKTKASTVVTKSDGISYINGQRYFHTIQFKTKEDRLVFALKFAEICNPINKSI